MNKIRIFGFINLISAFIFSILNISFKVDVSCFAFLICACFSFFLFYFLGYKFLLKKDCNSVNVSNKFLQYQCYVYLIAFIVRRAGENGTSFAYDLISVIFWIIVFVSCLFLQHYFNPKNFNKISEQKIKEVKNESVAKMFARGKTRDGKKVTGLDYVKWFGFEIADWVDAIVQAVFMVLLFQIFILQLYKIPSESMVPEFLINDKVAVSKINCGPKFPLTDIGLPSLKKYKRGDIVVFRNPHYSMDRKSEVKTVVSQMINMLTFTLVNPNVDENGKIKADPLVKRVTGVSGEQIMMQDGILYSRKKGSDEFVPVTEDASWASYNLYAEKDSIKKNIHDFVFPSEEIFDEIVKIEENRKALDMELVKAEAKKIAEDFSKYNPRGNNYKISKAEIESLLDSSDLFYDSLCHDPVNFAQRLITVPGGNDWFNLFMTDWINNYENQIKDGYVGGDLYRDSCFKLNLMIKLTLGRICVKIAKNINESVPANKWGNDFSLIQDIESLRQYFNYVLLHDQRNMSVFPPDDENGNHVYIPEDCYFMMGDNRFNSLDMRYSLTSRIAPVSLYDKYSITYLTYLNPMYVPEKYILGSTGFRFWPLSRLGMTGHTARD